MNPRREFYIIGGWFVLILATGLANLFPHRALEPIGFVNVSVQLLLCILSGIIAANSARSQRFIFINLSVFFGFIVPLYISGFVGTAIMNGNPYAQLLYTIYVNKIALSAVLIFAIVYLAFDVYRPMMATGWKYLWSSLTVAGLVFVLFQPYLTQPFSLYDAEGFAGYQILSSADAKFREKNGRPAGPEELAQAYASASQIADHGAHAADVVTAREIVGRLEPYLVNGGSTALFWQPLEERAIMSRLLVVVISATILFSFYRSGRPVSAYVDKIVMLFFLFGILEIVHISSSINSYSFDIAAKIFSAGQYVTVALFLVMIYAFDLKRRFVTSVTGKFYEQSLNDSPDRVTRLRDEIDLLILKTFSRTTRPKPTG